uniref:DUF1801 domain-containing protein n=1 Tax=Panagrellus redivivus TaxID=6233 RepID=A0A7E4ZYR0_PANRE
MFKLLHQFAFIKYLLDGLNINPMWQAALTINEIADKRQYIYVEDTLIIYCDSASSYEDVLPLILGPYTRLVLHGNITMNQIERLLHPGVKRVRINANIQMHPQQYAYFAEVIAKQVKDFNS